MVSTRASLSTLDDDDDEAISDDARRAERHPPRHADAVDVSIVFPFVVIVVRPENKVVFVFGRPDEAFFGAVVAVPETVVAVVGRIFRRRRRRRRLSKKQFRVVSIGPKSQSRSRRSRRRSRHRSILESSFRFFCRFFLQISNLNWPGLRQDGSAVNRLGSAPALVN